MKINPRPKFNGPIPGESLTADTRNYPWHRPPEITGFNEGVTRLIADKEDEREMQLIYSLLELEVPVAIITSNLLMRKIGRGVIPIDLAILMAGPVSRYVEILAKDNGLTADMDTDIPGQEPITPTMLKLQMGSVEDIQDLLEEGEVSPETPVEDAPEPTGGLMGIPTEDDAMSASDEEQAAMLGMAADEVEEEQV
jgi:hypothetical protein